MDEMRPRPRRGGLAATLPALLLLALAGTAGTGASSSAADSSPPPPIDMVVTGSQTDGEG